MYSFLSRPMFICSHDVPTNCRELSSAGYMDTDLLCPRGPVTCDRTLHFFSLKLGCRNVSMIFSMCVTHNHRKSHCACCAYVQCSRVFRCKRAVLSFPLEMCCTPPSHTQFSANRLCDLSRRSATVRRAGPEPVRPVRKQVR